MRIVRDFKALIFDMDGLMIDSERLYWEVERGIARSYGREIREETLWKMMGHRPIEGMRIFVEDVGLPVAYFEPLLGGRGALMHPLQVLSGTRALSPHIVTTPAS